MQNEVDFQETIKMGKPGEIIFRDDFLNFLGIKYIDVTGCQKYQVVDTDYLTKIGTYEIKTNYKDNHQIIIEEYTNYNKQFGPVSFGWFYKSKSDLLIFISKTTRTMVFVPFTQQFKEFYEQKKTNYRLIPNKITINEGKKWQSAFRVILLDDFNGFYSMYKKL
jgi:hypothetical protein